MSLLPEITVPPDKHNKPLEEWRQLLNHEHPATTVHVEVGESIQDAVDALLALGTSGTIILGEGDHSLTATLVLGHDSGFSGISLQGTNGLVGTTITWNGSTSGTAIKISKGRFNHVHDLTLINGVAEGTTIGLIITGPATSSNTSAAQIERVTISEFHRDMEIGDASSGRDASEITLTKVNLINASQGLYASGPNTLNIKLNDCGIAGLTEYGIKTEGGVNLSVFGGSYGNNLKAFHVLSSGVHYLQGIDDEASSDPDYYLVYAPTQYSDITVESYRIRCSTVFDHPLCFTQGGPITIRGQFAYGSNTSIIPWGCSDPVVAGFGLGGSATALRIEDSTIHESSVLMQFASDDSGADGLIYTFSNNIKLTTGGVASKLPNRAGIVIWPNEVDYYNFTPSTTPANSTLALDFLTTEHHKNISAPSTPASGRVVTYSDSADKTFKGKDDAGVVKVLVKPDAGTAASFLTGIGTDGVPTKAQPGAAVFPLASGVIQNSKTYTVSSSADVSIGTLTAGLFLIREGANGGSAIVLYENSSMMSIIATLGPTAFVSGAPGATEIQVKPGFQDVSLRGGSSRNGVTVYVMALVTQGV